MAVVTQYTDGQSIGTVFGSPAICKIDRNGKKVITQQIVAKDGKVGYIFRGRAKFAAGATDAVRVAGMVDGDIDQFEASDTLGLTEPAGLAFNDIQFSYAEDNTGTRVWQKSTDITASAVEKVIDNTNLGRSADFFTQITDFLAAYWLYLVGGGILLYVLFWMPMKDGKKKKKGFLG